MNSRLMENNFHVRFREHFFVENSSFPFVCVNSPAANSQLVGLQSLEPRRKPPSPSDSISLLTQYMWAPDIYEGSPTPVTAFLSIAPKISISANMSRLSIVVVGSLDYYFVFNPISSKNINQSRPSVIEVFQQQEEHRLDRF